MAWCFVKPCSTPGWRALRHQCFLCLISDVRVQVPKDLQAICKADQTPTPRGSLYTCMIYFGLKVHSIRVLWWGLSIGYMGTWTLWDQGFIYIAAPDLAWRNYVGSWDTPSVTALQRLWDRISDSMTLKCFMVHIPYWDSKRICYIAPISCLIWSSRVAS